MWNVPANHPDPSPRLWLPGDPLARHDPQEGGYNDGGTGPQFPGQDH